MPKRILMRVTRIGRVLTVVLAGFWLVAVNHCKLEEVPWLSFLGCCTHEDAPSGSHHEDDCETDGCATVEEGLYKTEEARTLVPSPSFFAAVIHLIPLLDEPRPSLGRSFLLTAASPELSRTWHFTFRAASPPRAPSLIA